MYTLALTARHHAYVTVTIATQYGDIMACPFSESCLGMCEWTDCPNGELQMERTASADLAPSPSQPHLLNAEPHQPLPFVSSGAGESRFSKFVSDEELAQLSRGMNNSSEYR